MELIELGESDFGEKIIDDDFCVAKRERPQKARMIWGNIATVDYQPADVAEPVATSSVPFYWTNRAHDWSGVKDSLRGELRARMEAI